MAITGGSVAHLCPTARAAFPSPSTLQQRNPLPAIDDATITSLAEAEQPGMDLEVTWIMKAPRSFDGRHSWEEALSYLLGSLCEAERRTGYTIKPRRQPPPLPILGFQGPVYHCRDSWTPGVFIKCCLFYFEFFTPCICLLFSPNSPPYPTPPIHRASSSSALPRLLPHPHYLSSWSQRSF